MEAAQAFVLPFLATLIVIGAIWYAVAHWNDYKEDKNEARSHTRASEKGRSNTHRRRP